MRRILVTGAGGPLGANVTRSLKAAPEPTFLLGTEANPWHLPLSMTDETVLIPRASAGDEYLQAMEGLIRQHGIELVVPTHPVEVRTIGAARDRLGARTYLPAQEVIERGDDKWRSYRAWAEAGIPVPRTDLLESPDDLARIFREVERRPIWVRGAGIPGAGIGVASLPCRELDQAQAWVGFWKGWGKMIASEYLPGENLTWMSLWWEGELVTSQARERLEYVLPHVSPSGITGAPAVSRTVSRPDLDELGPRALRAVDPHPHGVYFLDLKGDPEGRPRITEVNAGRFGTTVHFYTEAGFNFPWLYVQLALGLPHEPPPRTGVLPPGIWWIRTLDCGPAIVRDGAAFELPLGASWTGPGPLGRP